MNLGCLGRGTLALASSYSVAFMYQTGLGIAFAKMDPETNDCVSAQMFYVINRPTLIIYVFMFYSFLIFFGGHINVFSQYWLISCGEQFLNTQ